MSSEDTIQAADFLPLVRPPQKDDKSDSFCFAFRNRELLLIGEEGNYRLPLMKEMGKLGFSGIRTQYLGELRDISCYSMELDGSKDTGELVSGNPFENLSLADVCDLSEKTCFVGLRELSGILEETLTALAGKAVHIMEWDKNTLYCGRCGSETSIKEEERAKQCPECGFTSFPKISPAIIVMIEKEDKVLLARSPHFPPGRYSIIAGFVEPGESIEQAVVREVKEEVGVQIKNIRYFGSQPWPFPDSLMIGFTAEHAEGDIKIDGIEIEDAGWYRIDEIPHAPGTTSISGQLIRYFIDRHS
ncbi:NAD(+) diphosphatase [Methanolobus sediminis]|uniref:NAD(+) diphosphatase n=1 Tax=Methanolobus sediminis TaxID=3072978 RepID=A0AA51UKV8_9EURY|nr:NAD(+) diphosphatase [Methanolobus sediminis]WMW24963.1 NAD(+) diphosphatase [Methanolobus sediminis]